MRVEERGEKWERWMLSGVSCALEERQREQRTNATRIGGGGLYI